MGIGRDLNHPPTKWEFMLQILNSSRCPEKKGNCTVLSTCFFQLRFGFLKLKLQLTLKQTNIRNGTPPVSHQSFCRFNYLFFPPVMRLQIHCLDVPIAPAKRKKNCQVWQWISQVLFSKWQFLNWDFKKSDQTFFLGWKKTFSALCRTACQPFQTPSWRRNWASMLRRKSVVPALSQAVGWWICTLPCDQWSSQCSRIDFFLATYCIPCMSTCGCSRIATTLE